jgi:hypothetical protein
MAGAVIARLVEMEVAVQDVSRVPTAQFMIHIQYILSAVRYAATDSDLGFSAVERCRSSSKESHLEIDLPALNILELKRNPVYALL